MAKRKKKDDQDKAVKLLILVTALINLLRAIIDFIDRLLE